MRLFLALCLIAVIWLGAATAQPQPNDVPKNADNLPSPNAKPNSLEQLQEEALKNNTDIRVAEAKVRLAEAELERTRANIKLKIALAIAEVDAARAGYEEGKERFLRAKILYEKKAIAIEDFRAAKLTMEKLGKEVAVIEARLHLLVGRPAAEKLDPKQPAGKKKS